LDITGSSSQFEDTDDDNKEFRLPSTSAASQSTSTPKHLNVLSSPEVAGALDRVNLPDCGAMFVVASVAKALGHPVEDLTLSQSTIRRTRMATHKEVSEADKDSFSTQCPLLLHWDGKLLPCINGTKETVDRIAVIVIGN